VFTSNLIYLIHLCLGCPQDEMKLMSESLENLMKEQVLHIARIDPTGCSNIKMTFQFVCKQLIRENCDVSLFEVILKIKTCIVGFFNWSIRVGESI